jgi:hypothetical protein
MVRRLWRRVARHPEASREDGLPCHKLPLLAVLCESKARRNVRFESIACARNLVLHVALCTVNVVPENMKSCSISLCLNGHRFLRLWSHRVTHARFTPEGRLFDAKRYRPNGLEHAVVGPQVIVSPLLHLVRLRHVPSARRLTFDLSGPPQAGPLEGRVRRRSHRHSQLPRP